MFLIWLLQHIKIEWLNVIFFKNGYKSFLQP